MSSFIYKIYLFISPRWAMVLGYIGIKNIPTPPPGQAPNPPSWKYVDPPL